MPIYEYHCHNCGQQVEVWLRSRDSAPSCPHCGSALSERLFSLSYVVKGGAARPHGQTCCGRDDRCDRPPCSEDRGCQR